MNKKVSLTQCYIRMPFLELIHIWNNTRIVELQKYRFFYCATLFYSEQQVDYFEHLNESCKQTKLVNRVDGRVYPDKVCIITFIQIEIISTIIRFRHCQISSGCTFQEYPHISHSSTYFHWKIHLSFISSFHVNYNKFNI